MTNTPEINDFYKVLLENQNSTLQLVSFILLTITVLLLGASFLWNFYFSNKKIENKINLQKKEFEDLFTSKMKEMEVELITKVSSEVDKSINALKADTSRIFALHTYSKELFDTSLNWWIDCLERTLKTKNHMHVRWILDEMIRVLENPKFVEYSNESLNVEKGKLIINSTPDIFEPEKKKIIKKIDKLKVEKDS